MIYIFLMIFVYHSIAVCIQRRFIAISTIYCEINIYCIHYFMLLLIVIIIILMLTVSVSSVSSLSVDLNFKSFFMIWISHSVGKDGCKYSNKLIEILMMRFEWSGYLLQCMTAVWLYDCCMSLWDYETLFIAIPALFCLAWRCWC